MARSAPTCGKGSEPGVGSGQRRVIMDLIYNTVGGYDVGTGDYPYTCHNYVSGGYQFEIIHGIGDPLIGAVNYKGDTDFFMVMQEYASGVYFNAALDYCDSAHTYLRRTPNGYAGLTFSDTAAFDWWYAINEYECVFVIAQSGIYYGIWFGQPLNGLADTSKIGGRTRLTAQVTSTGNGVALPVDRDLTGKLQAGQKIYLLNQTPDGTHDEAAAGALSDEHCEIVTVNTVVSDTVTVDGVINDLYKKGSPIGLYPWGGLIAGAGTSFATYYLMPTRPDAADGSSTPGATSSNIWTSADESYMDPDFADIYRMARIVCRAPSNLGVYGIPQLLYATTVGTQANGDRMLIDGDTSKAYWVFPSLSHSSWQNGCLAIGPGATV